MKLMSGGVRITRRKTYWEIWRLFSPKSFSVSNTVSSESPAGGSRHENAARSGEAHYVGVCVRTSYTRCNRGGETDAAGLTQHGSSCRWEIFLFLRSFFFFSYCKRCDDAHQSSTNRMRHHAEWKKGWKRKKNTQANRIVVRMLGDKRSESSVRLVSRKIARRLRLVRQPLKCRSCTSLMRGRC